MTEQQRPAPREALEELPYVDDRVSRLWVLLIIGVFAAIVAYGVLFGQAGLLSPQPTPSPTLPPTPVTSPSPPASPTPDGGPTPAVSPSPAVSPIPEASPSPQASPSP